MDGLRCNGPPSEICPERHCFFWVQADGKRSRPKRVYDSFKEALVDLENYPERQASGCACQFGLCKRLDPDLGDYDWYEPCEPALQADGLPTDYFNTKLDKEEADS